MVTLLALAAALLYGSADFLGGVATRRARLLSVLVVTAASGMVVQVAVAMVFGGPFRTGGLGWGLLAGAVGGVGLAFFYAGLATGPMSVVSPLSALVSTVLPVGFAIAAGERLGPAVYAGALVCLAATVLVSSGGQAPDRLGAEQSGEQPGAQRSGEQPGAQRSGKRPGAWRRQARGIGYGVASGATFGLFFLFMKYGGESGAFWPAAAARTAGFALYAPAALVLRTRPVNWRDGRAIFVAAVAAGAIDATANLCYVLATRAGLFGLAVVLTSLYPGVTVLAARLFLRERMHRLQQAGLVLAAIGIALVSA